MICEGNRALLTVAYLLEKRIHWCCIPCLVCYHRVHFDPGNINKAKSKILAMQPECMAKCSFPHRIFIKLNTMHQLTHGGNIVQKSPPPQWRRKRELFGIGGSDPHEDNGGGLKLYPPLHNICHLFQVKKRGPGPEFVT